MSQRVSYFYH
jgi:acetoin utilization deacetylase AcuC-like enzyme